MTRRRRYVPAGVTRTWTIVRAFMRCDRACPIYKGEPALLIHAGQMRSVRCAPCAKLDYGMEPPTEATRS